MADERLHPEEFEEEQPLIALPGLLWGLVGIASFFVGLSVLFLPWYLALVIYFSGFIAAAIFLNPFFSILLYIFGAFLRPLAFAPQLAQYQITVIAGFGILLAWAMHISVYRDFKLPRSRQFLFFIGFGAICFFSSLVYWDESSFGFFELVKVFLIYFLAAMLISSKSQMNITLKFVIFLGVVSAVFAIYQQMHGLGLPLAPGVIRPTSFEGDPNYLAIDMVILIPFLVAFYKTSRSLFAKLFAAAAFALFILTIIITFSRAGVLGLGVVLMLCLWNFFPGHKRLIVLLLIVISGLLALPYIPGYYFERIKSITNLSEISIKGRLDGYIVGALMMADHPFTGVGIGRWALAYWEKAITIPDIQTKWSWFPHNLFVEVGSQAGFFALIMLILIMVYVFKDLRFAMNVFRQKGDEKFSAYTLALKIGLIGFLVCALFVAALYLKLFWVLLGFTVAFRRLAEERSG